MPEPRLPAYQAAPPREVVNAFLNCENDSREGRCPTTQPNASSGGEPGVSTNKNHRSWELRKSGADHTELLLPGGLWTAAFFKDLMAEPRMIEAPIRLVAATRCRDSGAPHIWRITMENFNRFAGKLASGVGCDVVVSHSLSIVSSVLSLRYTA